MTKIGLCLMVLVSVTAALFSAENKLADLPTDLVQEVLLQSNSLEDAIKAVRLLRETSPGLRNKVDERTLQLIAQLAQKYTSNNMTVALLMNTPIARSLVKQALATLKKKSLVLAERFMTDILAEGLQLSLSVQEYNNFIQHALDLDATIRHLEGMPLPKNEWLWKNEVGVQNAKSLEGFDMLANRKLLYAPGLDSIDATLEVDFAIHRFQDGSFVHSALSHLEGDEGSLYIAEFTNDLKQQGQTQVFKIPYENVNLVAVYPHRNRSGYVIALEKSNGKIIFAMLTRDGQWSEIGTFTVYDMKEILYPSQYKREFGAL